MVVDVGQWSNQSVNVGLILLLSEYCGRLFQFTERTGRGEVAVMLASIGKAIGTPIAMSMVILAAITAVIAMVEINSLSCRLLSEYCELIKKKSRSEMQSESHRKGDMAIIK